MRKLKMGDHGTGRRRGVGREKRLPAGFRFL